MFSWWRCQSQAALLSSLVNCVTNTSWIVRISRYIDVPIVTNLIRACSALLSSCRLPISSVICERILEKDRMHVQNVSEVLHKKIILHRTYGHILVNGLSFACNAINALLNRAIWKSTCDITSTLQRDHLVITLVPSVRKDLPTIVSYELILERTQESDHMHATSVRKISHKNQILNVTWELTQEKNRFHAPNVKNSSLKITTSKLIW